MTYSTKDQNTAINQYNLEAYDTVMSSMMGEERWSQHKSRVNLGDLLGANANDNDERRG